MLLGWGLERADREPRVLRPPRLHVAHHESLVLSLGAIGEVDVQLSPVTPQLVPARLAQRAVGTRTAQRLELLTDAALAVALGLHLGRSDSLLARGSSTSAVPRLILHRVVVGLGARRHGWWKGADPEMQRERSDEDAWNLEAKWLP